MRRRPPTPGPIGMRVRRRADAGSLPVRTRAYELRVDFEQLWECPNEEEAEAFAMKWTREALRSRRKPLQKFAHTVRDHLDGILMFFRYPGQTSGLAEGMNNKIKLLIHKAYGFHNVAALIAMVYLCCTGIRLP